MAIDISVLGNQLEVTDTGTNKVDWVNLDDYDLSIDTANVVVSLIQTSSKNVILSRRNFADFNTPSGADALAVARAIALLGAAIIPGSVPQDSIIIDPSTAGSELTPVAANASSVELLPALATRVETRIRNDGTGILYVTIGATATVNSANKLLQDDWIDITEGLVVNGIWVGINGFARMNEIVK